MRGLLLALLLVGCASAPPVKEVSVDPYEASRPKSRNVPQPPSNRLPPPLDKTKPAPDIDALAPHWVEAVVSGQHSLTPSLHRYFYQMAVNDRLLRHDWGWLEAHAAELRRSDQLLLEPPPITEFYASFRKLPDRALYPSKEDIQEAALQAWMEERPQATEARIALAWNAMAEAWTEGRRESERTGQRMRQVLKSLEAPADPEYFCMLAEVALMLEGSGSEFREALDGAYRVCPEYFRAQLLDCAVQSDWFDGVHYSDWEKGLKSDRYYGLILRQMSQQPLAKSDLRKPRSIGAIADYPRAFKSMKELVARHPDRVDWIEDAIAWGISQDVQWMRQALRELGPQSDTMDFRTLETHRRQNLAGEQSHPVQWARLSPLDVSGLGLERWILQAQVRYLIGRHRFAELEEVGQRWASDKSTWPDGGYKFTTFLGAFMPKQTTSESDSDMERFFKAWEKKSPNSRILPLAIATFLVGKGWREREFADGDPSRDWSRWFDSATDVLDVGKVTSSEGAYLKMQIARALGKTVDSHFMATIKFLPNHWPAYRELGLAYDDNSETFDRKARWAIKVSRRPGAYALMAQSLQRRGRLMNFDTVLLEKGFQDLEKLTKWKGWAQQGLFSAALTGAQAVAGRALKGVPADEADPKVFGSLENYQKVASWANSSQDN